MLDVFALAGQCPVGAGLQLHDRVSGTSGTWQTWTKPRGITMVFMPPIGGAGGGGGGFSAAAGNARGGGGGGGGGNPTRLLVPAFVIPDLLYVQPVPAAPAERRAATATRARSRYVSTGPTVGNFAALVASGSTAAAAGPPGAAARHGRGRCRGEADNAVTTPTRWSPPGRLPLQSQPHGRGRRRRADRCRRPGVSGRARPGITGGGAGGGVGTPTPTSPAAPSPRREPLATFARRHGRRRAGRGRVSAPRAADVHRRYGRRHERRVQDRRRRRQRCDRQRRRRRRRRRDRRRRRRRRQRPRHHRGRLRDLHGQI